MMIVISKFISSMADNMNTATNANERLSTDSSPTVASVSQPNYSSEKGKLFPVKFVFDTISLIFIIAGTKTEGFLSVLCVNRVLTRPM